MPLQEVLSTLISTSIILAQIMGLSFLQSRRLPKVWKYPAIFYEFVKEKYGSSEGVSDKNNAVASNSMILSDLEPSTAYLDLHSRPNLTVHLQKTAIAFPDDELLSPLSPGEISLPYTHQSPIQTWSLSIDLMEHVLRDEWGSCNHHSMNMIEAVMPIVIDLKQSVLEPVLFLPNSFMGFVKANSAQLHGLLPTALVLVFMFFGNVRSFRGPKDCTKSVISWVLGVILRVYSGIDILSGRTQKAILTGYAKLGFTLHLVVYSPYLSRIFPGSTTELNYPSSAEDLFVAPAFDNPGSESTCPILKYDTGVVFHSEPESQARMASVARKPKSEDLADSAQALLLSPSLCPHHPATSNVELDGSKARSGMETSLGLKDHDDIVFSDDGAEEFTIPIRKETLNPDIPGFAAITTGSITGISQTETENAASTSDLEESEPTASLVTQSSAAGPAQLIKIASSVLVGDAHNVRNHGDTSIATAPFKDALGALSAARMCSSNSGLDPLAGETNYCRSEAS